VIGAPGHTDGSIAVHVPSQRLLFTGDNTVRALADLDVDTACSGHGGPVRADASQALRDAVREERFILG
jgi:hypothetical protein